MRLLLALLPVTAWLLLIAVRSSHAWTNQGRREKRVHTLRGISLLAMAAGSGQFAASRGLARSGRRHLIDRATQ